METIGVAAWNRYPTPEDLKDHACLIYTLARHRHEWTFRREEGHPYTVAVDGPLHLNDDHVQRQAALDGLGILHMPKLFLREAIEHGRLIQLWPDETAPVVTLAVVYPSRQDLPAKVRAFVEFMAEQSAGASAPTSR